VYVPLSLPWFVTCLIVIVSTRLLNGFSNPCSLSMRRWWSVSNGYMVILWFLDLCSGWSVSFRLLSSLSYSGTDWLICGCHVSLTTWLATDVLTANTAIKIDGNCHNQVCYVRFSTSDHPQFTGYLIHSLHEYCGWLVGWYVYTVWRHVWYHTDHTSVIDHRVSNFFGIRGRI
jgi:hypothetical protein